MKPTSKYHCLGLFYTMVLILILLAPELGQTTQAQKINDNELIVLKVRFHLPSGIMMESKGQKMTVWVTTENIKGSLLPEINRIWRPAGIQFEIESIEEYEAIKPANSDKLLREIIDSHRDEDGHSDDTRLPKIKQFFTPAKKHPTAHNVFFFPYLGQTSQGNARFKGNELFVGVWTDKPTKAKKPPQKTLLNEPEPFKIGSLGRTLAHELGHNLGLKHPPKEDMVPYRLMGGTTQGYLLTKEEIKTSRDEAKHHQNGYSKSK